MRAGTVAKLMYLFEGRRDAGVVEVEMQHDDDCPALASHRAADCDCDADVKVKRDHRVQP